MLPFAFHRAGKGRKEQSWSGVRLQVAMQAGNEGPGHLEQPLADRGHFHADHEVFWS